MPNLKHLTRSGGQVEVQPLVRQEVVSRLRAAEVLDDELAVGHDGGPVVSVAVGVGLVHGFLWKQLQHGCRG